MIVLNGDWENNGRLENRLERIANILLINASFIDNPGLLKGKMGIAIFFYHYYRYTQNKIYEDFAGELIDEIYEEINTTTPVDFENGLTGTGWGIEYLVKNKFVAADTDEALEELDNIIYRKRLQSQILINGENDIFGYGLYYIARITGHKIDDDDINTLIKKYHLIFLIDECERILLSKDYLKHNIKSLRSDTLNSCLWFLLEVDRLKIYPAKVQKILSFIPEYINDILNDPVDPAGMYLNQNLLKKTIDTVSDKSTKNVLKDLFDCTRADYHTGLTSDEAIVDYHIKTTWLQLLYWSFISERQEIVTDIERFLIIIENEEYWNNRLKKISNETLGLTGLAGLGLGLLIFQNELHKGQVQEQMDD